MSSHAQICDSRRIADFLKCRLSDSDQVVLEDHLGECATCRNALVSQSAVTELWDKASRYLREDDCEPIHLPGDSAGLTEHDQSASITTVLEALAPTDDPEMLGRLSGYEVSGVVGAGGMGVALKAIDGSRVGDPGLGSAFGVERCGAKAVCPRSQGCAAVLHPNVMASHSVSNDGNCED